MIGQTILNYKIISLIGEGGMGDVYLAVHQELKHKVAIKFLKINYARKTNIRKRFLSEARTLAKLNHPNIIKVTDLIDAGDIVAFVMDYISGISLKELIEKKGKLRDEEIKTIFLQILNAVGFIHKVGLVHRDIKPDNFMVNSDGNIKLLDFGIVKKLFLDDEFDYTETGVLDIMGTPLYMSPEQMENTKDVTASTDIYSLGLVLWFMVIGKTPYNTKNLSFLELIKKKNDRLPMTRTKWDKIIQTSAQYQVSKRFKNTSEIEILIKNIKIDNNAKVGKTFKVKNAKQKFLNFSISAKKYFLGQIDDKKKKEQREFFVFVIVMFFVLLFLSYSKFK